MRDAVEEVLNIHLQIILVSGAAHKRLYTMNGSQYSAIVRYHLYFRVIPEPDSPCALIASRQKNQGTVSIKIDYSRAVTMAPMPGPLTDPDILATGWLCFRSPHHPSKQDISAGLESPCGCSPSSRVSTGNQPELIL